MSAPPRQESATARDLANLDVMRALAVGLVVMAHLLEIYAQRTQADAHPLAWHVGRTGVLIFFVHTSLVLMASMARTKESGAALFAHFYVRRAFRIYPLAIVAVATTLWLGAPQDAWLEHRVDFSTGEIVSNFLLVQNLTYSRLVLSPLWSLPLEVQMYVALPIAFVLLGRVPEERQKRRVAIGLLAAGLAASTLYVALRLPDRFDILLFVPCFLAGILASVRGIETRFQLPAALWPVAIGLLTVLYSLLARSTGEPHPPWVAWLYCLAIALAIPHFRPLAPGRVQRAAQRVAKYSYGIYLFHMLGIWLAWGPLSPLDLSPLAAFGVFLTGLTIVPVAMYHGVEEPFIRLGGRVAKRIARVLGSTPRERMESRRNFC